VPPRVVHPSGVELWFTDPPGWVTRLARPGPGSIAMAEFISEAAWSSLVAAHPAGTRFVLVADYSLMHGYDKQARQILTSWCLDVRDQLEECVVLLSPGTPSLVRMGFTTGAAVLSAAGLRFRVDFGSLEDVIATYGLRAG
jgi:hypothetical protein